MTVLLDAWQDWECPACHLADRTRPLPPAAARFHPCPGLHGLSAPLVRSGADCRIVAVEREDYLRGEKQATGDDGKPYMAIRTDYGDGRSNLVMNPAVARLGGVA